MSALVKTAQTKQTIAEKDCKSKCEKLKSFKNLLQQAGLTQAIPEEKKNMECYSYNEANNNSLDKEEGKRQCHCIKNYQAGINSNLYTNMIRKQDLNWSWKTLQQICS